MHKVTRRSHCARVQRASGCGALEVCGVAKSVRVVRSCAMSARLHDASFNDKEKDDLELDSVSRYTRSMSTEATQQLVEQWRALQSAYLKTSNALDRELSARHGIGLNEFETLDLVAEHSSEACRMK